ncbi:hypothetical protein H1A25_13845 [Escherichia coli]|nr:hypothetical protein [Escherichia coli]
MAQRQTDNVTMGRFPPLRKREGGEPPTGEDDMQQRVRELEKDVQSIKTDLAVMKSNYATKEDVSNAKNSIIMWVVGAVIFAQLIPALPAILDAVKRMLSG